MYMIYVQVLCACTYVEGTHNYTYVRMYVEARS